MEPPWTPSPTRELPSPAWNHSEPSDPKPRAEIRRYPFGVDFDKEPSEFF